MAGYSRIYCLGGEGGFMGADGINPIGMQIWQGEGGRQWLEAHYFDAQLSPMGQITTVIPGGPNGEDALLDAFLAFAPQLFTDCPSLDQVSREAAGLERIDFDLGAEAIPQGWAKLREEARPIFAGLIIYVGDLLPLVAQPGR
jgi:hypothetical protein